MIIITIISIAVTLLSIVFGAFGLISERRRKRSFDEYSNETDKLINFLTKVTEDSSISDQGNSRDVMTDVLKLVYHANLFSLKDNIIKAALMWLWENGTKGDIETIKRAVQHKYIRSKENRTFAKLLIEHLTDKDSQN